MSIIRSHIFLSYLERQISPYSNRYSVDRLSEKWFFDSEKNGFEMELVACGCRKL